MNIVLMAGGGGTRLWPLSRKNSPKQFIKLGNNTTLLEQTYQRALALTDAANIYIATTREYGDRVRELLPAVNPKNIFFEPERRDNTAAFASVAIQLKLAGQGDEVAVHMWSDHVFTAESEYIKDIQKIPQVLAGEPRGIMIVGHVPTFPETGFGYIETGELLPGYDDVYRVVTFKEKPDLQTAQEYVAAGKYFWNMGSVSMRPNYLLEELTTQSPEFGAGIAAFEQAVSTGDEAQIASAYALFPKISIDYSLLEKAPKIFVVTGDYGWSDVGNWAAMQAIFGISGDHMPHGHHVHVDADQNYVYNTTSRCVSLIGIHDSIVVVTDDAVLITHKDSAHKVKDVVAKLEAEGKTDYL